MNNSLITMSHFDSRMAMTIIIIKDPGAIHPDAHLLQQQTTVGAKNPITYMDIVKMDIVKMDIVKMDIATFKCICNHFLHILFCVLTELHPFDFQNYSGKDNSLFTQGYHMGLLPMGPEYSMCSYMLNTVHIEEASYKGNDHILKQWWKQLGFKTQEHQKALG